MAQYRVKVGCELAHNGTVVGGGEDVTLDPAVAFEVRHLVDTVDPVTNDATPIGTARDEAALLSDLERARPHERVSLIEQAISANVSDKARLDKLLADAQALDAQSRPAAKAAPARPTFPANRVITEGREAKK